MEDIKRGVIRPVAPPSSDLVAAAGKRRARTIRHRRSGGAGNVSRQRKTRSLFRLKPRVARLNDVKELSSNRAMPRTFEIRISLKSIVSYARRLAVQGQKRIRLLVVCSTVALLVALAISGALHFLHKPIVGNNDPATSSSAQQPTGPVPGNPSYNTLLPVGKSVASLGGWYRISPPDRDPVYAFTDKVAGVKIDVSEQPLPDSFKDNTAESIAQLAQSFNAGQKLSVKGTTVYVGTSAKGPQSLIFSKNNLLVLIKSAAIVSNDQWVGYVNSLN